MASQPAHVTIASKFIHNEPFPVTANMVADAIMAADAARHARSNLTSSLFLAQASQNKLLKLRTTKTLTQIPILAIS